MRRLVAALLALSLIIGSGLDARDEPIPGWFDLPVPGGIATLEALEMTLEERAFTLPVLARGLYDRDQRIGITQARLAKVLAEIDAQSASSRETVAIPAPLEADIWRELLPPGQTTCADRSLPATDHRPQCAAARGRADGDSPQHPDAADA